MFSEIKKGIVSNTGFDCNAFFCCFLVLFMVDTCTWATVIG